MSQSGPGVALRADIQRSGYYPEIVGEALDTALGSEEVISYVVHHEAPFDREELRRHVTGLVLTANRLIVCHVDEHSGEEAELHYATASTEAVRLERVDSVVVTRVVSNPADHRPGGPTAEVVLTIGWGAVSRIDLEPAGCQDPRARQIMGSREPQATMISLCASRRLRTERTWSPRFSISRGRSRRRLRLVPRDDESPRSWTRGCDDLCCLCCGRAGLSRRSRRWRNGLRGGMPR